MEKLINELYSAELPDRTLKIILMSLADARPSEIDTIYKNVTENELPMNIRKKMRIVETKHAAANVNAPCDSCPDNNAVASDGVKMSKIKVKDTAAQTAQPKDLAITDVVESNKRTRVKVGIEEPQDKTVLEVLNRFSTSRVKLIEYCKEKGYPFAFNAKIIELAQIIADHEY